MELTFFCGRVVAVLAVASGEVCSDSRTLVGEAEPTLNSKIFSKNKQMGNVRWDIFFNLYLLSVIYKVSQFFTAPTHRL